MVVFSVYERLRGLFARLEAAALLLLLICCACGAAVQSKHATRIGATQHLQRGIYLGELYNWAAAAPDFRAAEQGFNALRDQRNALYAHLGVIRATIERHNLPSISAELAAQLESNPLLQLHDELRLFCLIVKGDVDLEIDTREARRDWEQVKMLAPEVHNELWQNRALAQIGISAFYDRDLETASKNVGTAVATAARIHDTGALIRFTTVLGMALNEAKMYGRAIPYFDNALEIAKTAPDAGYPYFTHEAQLQALVGLKRYDDAQRLADEMLKEAGSGNRTGHRAEILSFAARIAVARGDIRKAVADLQRCVQFCKTEGYLQLESEAESMLAEAFRNTGDLQHAEYFATEAARSSQLSGNKWSLPSRFQILAELQVARGEYMAADRTYDKASAFIDSGLANSPSVLEKTALIKASGSLYPEHFALLASKLNNPMKAYSIVAQVRGRVNADLLLSGSVNSEKAKQIEHRISSLQLEMMNSKSDAEMARLRDQIFTVEEQRWISPGISILKRKAQETVPVGTVRRALDGSTAILEYVVADPQSFCMVISRDSFKIIPIAGESQINGLVAAYLKGVRDKLAAQSEARELYNLLLRPIPEVQRSENLVIVRDGQLHFLPFDALQTPAGTYIGDSHIIAYAPSVRSFYLLRREANYATHSLGHSLLAVGGIPYSEGILRSIDFEQDGGTTHLPDLLHSKEEVMDASSALKSNNTLLIGHDATESAFKRAASQPYGIIHLAVHGLPAEADPDQASVVLLPDRAVGEDGVLHASEIVMLHLRANLVVLSACDTALGPVEGEEGIATLANSFLLAGVRAVVSTLWAADDTSSVFLMQQFYTRLAVGDSPAVALTYAKRQMRHTFGNAAVPYYWAGFTFEGALAPSKPN